MFTRYLTFVFLVGLSALFFTSGRSATPSDELRKGLVNTAATAG